MEPKNYKKAVFTIPNLLSFFRLCLIPVIVWLYVGIENYQWAGYILILSGLTDIVDGFIARHYHMISDLGKVLDPIADKLTQAVVLVCLMVRYPDILWPFALMVAKEAFMAVSGILVIKRTGIVLGANWHGKAATVLLYGTMFLHIFWHDIPQMLSRSSIAACTGMVLISFVLYGSRNIRILKEQARKEGAYV